MHISSPLILLLILSLIGTLGSGLSAQEAKQPEAEKEEKLSNLSAYISVVALGPVPQRKYKMPDEKDLEKIAGEDGDGRPDRKGQAKPDAGAGAIPILLPTVSGAIPPAALYYKSPKPKEGNPWARLRVGYNNATSITPVPAGITLKLHQLDREENSEYKTYMTVPPMVPATQVILFLTPDGTGSRPWMKTPKISTLNIRSEALRDKNIIVRNFSSKAVTVKIASGEPEVLNGGQRKSFNVEQKGSFTQIAAMIATSRQPLINTVVRLPAKTLTVLAFYDADPVTNGGKSVGVFRTTVSKLPPEVLNKPNVPSQ
ncbi:hypothetical protein NT6N_10230 [Oceaniferula spumae]|uniref:Uncharacterized protein n=1 Tax=Oceaniferula spumae TaxID=2979115 RepID=A0AAT9FJ44_9BACT